MKAIPLRAFLICGILAFPFFMTLVFLQPVLHPNYSSLLYPLSSMAMGASGWIQISNFIFTGILLLLFSIGLRRIYVVPERKFRGPFLISLVGIGLIGAGIFVTDPVYGYPPGQPLLLKQVSIHGHLHDFFSLPVFICLPWACLLFRKYFKTEARSGWAMYSSFTAVAMLAFFVLCSMGFKQLTPFVHYAGLFQRLSIISGGLWISLLALHLLSSGRQKSAS